MIGPPVGTGQTCAFSGLLVAPNSPAPNAEAPNAPIQSRRVKLLFFMDTLDLFLVFFITGRFWVQRVFEILETILSCFQNACPRSENVFERELHLPHISTGYG